MIGPIGWKNVVPPTEQLPLPPEVSPSPSADQPCDIGSAGCSIVVVHGFIERGDRATVHASRAATPLHRLADYGVAPTGDGQVGAGHRAEDYDSDTLVVNETVVALKAEESAPTAPEKAGPGLIGVPGRAKGRAMPGGEEIVVHRLHQARDRA